MHNSLWRPVADLLHSAQKKVIIVSAFIRSDTLEFLLSHVSKDIDISIYARWRIEDIVFGASNIEVLDVVKQYKARMKVHEKLHAKIYIADDVALVGSANATNVGLGRHRPGQNNLEILIRTSTDRSEISEVLAVLEKHAKKPRPYTNKYIQQIKNAKVPFSQEAHADSIDNWLPSSSPKAVLQVIHGKGGLTDNAIKDCYLLEVGAGTSEVRMGEIVRSRRIFSVLDDALASDYSKALPDDKVVQIISNSFSIEDIYAENKWDILREWITMFSNDMYVGRGKTSRTELRRGQGSGDNVRD